MRASSLAIAGLLVGVALSAIAQIMLKVAMTRPEIQRHLRDGAETSLPLLARDLLSSLPLWGGLALYGASVLVWLYVLSKLDVSLAYPFVGLGIVLTLMGGHFLLGEPVTAQRIVGSLVVCAGLVVIARS